MSPNTLHPASSAGTQDPSQKGLFTAGAIGALAAIMIFILDIAISMAGEDFNPAALTAVDWFALYQADGLNGLRALGFLNILSLTITLPLYFALYTALRQHNQSFAALALIVFLLGAAIYMANNAAIPMFVLSQKYAAAGAENQRMLLAAAGEAVIARGADFAPGSFIGFFFTEMAGLAFAILMLGGGVFNRGAAVTGITGFLLLAIFTIWQTFFPVFFEAAMIVAMLGGLAIVAWYLLTARKLFQLARSGAGAAGQPSYAVKGV